MLDVALFAQDDALTHKLRQALESMDAKVERYTSWLSDSSICGTRQFDLMVVHPMSSVMDLASTWARGNRWAKPVATIALMPDQHMAFAPALLDAGFDRCLPLSLDNASLCAMVRAVTRRSQGMTTSVCHYGALSFNHVTHQASVRDVAVDLTFREAQVLAILLKRVGQVVSKNRFIEDMAPDDMALNSNAVEVYIHRLRKKLSHDVLPVRNIKRCGYLLPRYAHASDGALLSAAASKAGVDSVWPRNDFVSAHLSV